MKTNLENMLRNASQAINPRKDKGSYAYMLTQVADHIAQVRDGSATLAEFAEFYMMTEGAGMAPRWKAPEEIT